MHMLSSQHYSRVGTLYEVRDFILFMRMFFGFFSLRIFLLEQKLHMAWQQSLVKAMASPRKLQHDTSKK